MQDPLLLTKLYLPPHRPNLVPRPRLFEKLNAGLSCKLILISAPAGFGKTTLVSEWCFERMKDEGGWMKREGEKNPYLAPGVVPPDKVAWLSLDEGDNDLTRFLMYFIAALQTLDSSLGENELGVLQSVPHPPIESILTSLLNDITAFSEGLILVLDDYHLIDSHAVNEALAFLAQHLPVQIHLVILTREDPPLPLARLRACGQLTELRAADLRFTPSEAAEFLNRAMGLNLSAGEIAALETRTEGWIAGLQMAAISMQGISDASGFIQSFTGSNRFVLDYLMEEVLERQPVHIQDFLLRTSILDRLCGSLCDAVLGSPPGFGQETLEYLERANLFIVPLDQERRWYRYHHLFAELLRQRLHALYSQQPDELALYHIRASQWQEENAHEFEAFRHAVAANDIERAERLSKGGKMPLYSLAVVNAILKWLDSLPKTVLDARPWLWVRSAISILMTGSISGVEGKLQAAEKTIANRELDDNLRDLIGQIAAIRATIAAVLYQPEAAVSYSRRALENLYPENLPYRSRATFAQGIASLLQGDRTTARRLFSEAVQLASGNTYSTLLVSAYLGKIQEADIQLFQAAETYRRSLQLMSEMGPPNASEEYIGLARIHYEWNDLDTAEQYGQESLYLARQYDPAIDRYIDCEIFLSRLKLARGDIAGAAAMLAETEQSVLRNNFMHRIPEVAAAQVLVFLKQRNLSAAAHLAQAHKLPLSQARVELALGDPAAALAFLEPLRREMEVKGWQDEQLKVMVLQALALHLHGEKEKALDLLGEALKLAEVGGFIRIFVDEGEQMQWMLDDFRFSKLKSYPHLSTYLDKLLAAFPSRTSEHPKPDTQRIIEPLTQREVEILKLITQGLSNREIGERLFLALDTVKGHNRRIFEKLQVQRRTEAIARARELGLL